MNDLAKARTFSNPRSGTTAAIHSVLSRAFRALDESESAWLLLRGENDLSRPQGDVDVLVSEDLLPQLDGLLRGVGLHRVVAPGHGSHRFYFSFDPVQGAWIKLDVVSRLEFGRNQQWPTPLAAECLGRRVRRGLLWLPDEDDKAWLELLHLLLDKEELPAGRLEAALSAAAVATADGPVVLFLEKVLGPRTSAWLLDGVRAGEPSDVTALSARLKDRWTRKMPGRTHLIQEVSRVLRLVSPVLKGRSAKGLMVAVMGPDGAGKTTLLQGIGADFPVPAKYVYMGMWARGSWDEWLHRLPGGKSGQKILRLLRGSTMARYQFLRGRLVLLDRVAYDALLPGSVDNSVGGRITRNLAFTVAPEPDVLLVLDAPGDVMFARKGEHSAEVLETWRRAYRELADHLPGSTLLDASAPQEQVRRLATEISWRSFIDAPSSSGSPRDAMEPTR
jgi:thymidylate kinase